MQLSADRRIDRQQLQSCFYQRFDHTRHGQLSHWSDEQIDARFELLGEGAHFRAWRLPEPQMGSGPRMDLVLKKAHAGFARSAAFAAREWLAIVPLLKRLTVLVPPFEYLSEPDGTLCLVMPYGDQPLAAASPHWQPTEGLVDELRLAVAASGLVWADVAQGRSWQGIPFIYDLSDFSLATARGLTLR